MFDLPLSDSELALWPLLHGSVDLESNVESIRGSGLRAPGSSGEPLNSFDYDRTLARTDFVFLSPARLSGGYGLGSVVMVDPAVLASPGIQCALFDFGEVIRQVQYLADELSQQLPEWVPERLLLTAIIEEHRGRTELRAESERVPSDLQSLWIAEQLLQSVFGSQEFSAYYQKCLMEPNEFFAALAARYAEDDTSLRDFLARENWQEPEVMVPRMIEPRYLLGYEMRGEWHSWSRPSSKVVAERLAELLALRGSARG